MKLKSLGGRWKRDWMLIACRIIEWLWNQENAAYESCSSARSNNRFHGRHGLRRQHDVGGFIWIDVNL